MKTLLTVTTIIEGATGLALLLAPGIVVSVLLGSSLAEPSGVLVGRLAGTALVSLAILCWMYRNAEHHAEGVVKAVLFYNVAAALLLVYAGATEFSGPLIWIVSLLHTGMAGWCLRLLLQRSTPDR